MICMLVSLLNQQCGLGPPPYSVCFFVLALLLVVLVDIWREVIKRCWNLLAVAGVYPGGSLSDLYCYLSGQEYLERSQPTSLFPVFTSEVLH